jgi:hypothetical protein
VRFVVEEMVLGQVPLRVQYDPNYTHVLQLH